MDTIQIVFWSITYLIIVANEVRLFVQNKNKQSLPFMPYFSGSLNLAWEATALIFVGMWGHYVWLILDVFIFAFNFRRLWSYSRRNAFVMLGLTLVFFVICCLCFSLRNIDGMLISVFVIDFIMELDYVLHYNKISLSGKTLIAVTKLLGDLFAWLAYLHASVFVSVVGILVLVLNLFYLSLCLEVNSKKSTKDRR